MEKLTFRRFDSGELDQQNGTARCVYERLKIEISLLEDISFGLYKPHFIDRRCELARSLGFAAARSVPRRLQDEEPERGQKELDKKWKGLKEFDDPEKFKAALNKVYESKKKLIRERGTTNATANWMVRGSTNDDAKMVKH